MNRRLAVAATTAALCAAASTAGAQPPAPTYPPYVGPAGASQAPQGVGIVSATSTDASGVIATAGAAQDVFGATPTNGFKIAIPSPSPAAFTCWLSDTTPTPGAATAGSYPVQAAGQYSSEVGEKPAGHVYLTCPAAGQVFSAKRW